MFIRAAVLALIASSSFLLNSQDHAQTAPAPFGANRICSARPAAALFAQALAAKIKAAMDAGAVAGKRSQASVRVSFSPPKTRPAVVKVDVSKDVNVSINLSATGDKISFQGAPATATLYQSCDPGKINFIIAISYRDLSKTPAAQVTLRQTLEVAIQGQFL